MSSKSDSEGRVGQSSGALVITNLIGAAAPGDIIDDLLDEGIVGHLDWEVGASANPEDIDEENSSGKGSLRRYAEFSRAGGYVITHMKHGDRVLIGRASPSSIRFEEIKGGKYDGKILKCVDLDVWAEIDEDEFEGIHEVIEARPRNVFHQIQDEDHAQRIVAALTTLEREGKVNR